VHQEIEVICHRAMAPSGVMSRVEIYSAASSTT
jgi:hypothetical protein